MGAAADRCKVVVELDLPGHDMSALGVDVGKSIYLVRLLNYLSSALRSFSCLGLLLECLYLGLRQLDAFVIQLHLARFVFRLQSHLDWSCLWRALAFATIGLYMLVTIQDPL